MSATQEQLDALADLVLDVEERLAAEAAAAASRPVEAADTA